MDVANSQLYYSHSTNAIEYLHKFIEWAISKVREDRDIQRTFALYTS